MKHYIVFLFLGLLLLAPPVSADAGPDDWLLENGRYTPTKQLPDCEDEIASVMVFLRLSLIQGTVWNAAQHNLQPPYDYSAAQLGLEMLSAGYPVSKLGVVDAYLDEWNRWGNLDNRELGKITAVLRPYVRTLANDLDQAC